VVGNDTTLVEEVQLILKECQIYYIPTVKNQNGGKPVHGARRARTNDNASRLPGLFFKKALDDYNKTVMHLMLEYTFSAIGNIIFPYFILYFTWLGAI